MRTFVRSSFVAVGLVLVACGGAGSGSPSTTRPSDATSSVTTSSVTLPSVTTVLSTTSSSAVTISSAVTTLPVTTLPVTVEPSTTWPEMWTGTIELPDGEFDLGAEDLFVAHVDGGLWVHPDALGDVPGAPWRLVDLEDARIAVGVAGVADGVVFYQLSAGSPLGPNLFAVAARNGDRTPLQVGLVTSVGMSPDRARLATTGPGGLVVIDLTTGSYEARGLPCGVPQPMMPCVLVDMIWAPDGVSLVFLYVDGYYGLMSVDPRVPFETVVLGRLGLVPSRSPDFDIHLAGLGPNGEIAVSVGDATTTVIRFYDAATLAERREMQRTLPPGVTSVRLADDGVGLLWVDGTTLCYLPDGGDVRDLGSGYTEAWYAV